MSREPNMTNVLELIEAKKASRTNTAAEIADLVRAYLTDEVPDHQMADWLMAVRLNGLNETEIAALTESFVRSGRSFKWDGLGSPVVDKHSTGGVGDKTSLVVVPLAAACGLAVPKISGRGLSFTGGTVDKLEAIPAMRVELDAIEFERQVRGVGAAIVSQSADLVPADRRIYELRDATGTVDAPGLIAASIMSKKLAAGAGTLLIDVKVGSGAFIKDHESAAQFAEMLIEIGKAAGRNVRVLLTGMDQPLGYAVGHAVEVEEALRVLKGNGPPDLVELAVTIVAALIRDSGLRPAPRAARQRAERALASGAAESKFREIVAAQGGDLESFERDLPHKQMPVKRSIESDRAGYVTQIDAGAVASALRELGGARRTKNGELDRDVGLYITKKLGDVVAAGEEWGWIGARDAESAEAAKRIVLRGMSVDDSAPPSRNLILGQMVG